MKLSSRLSAAALTIAASLAMGADQSALAQHTERQQTAAVQTVPPLAGSGINSGLTPAFAGYHQVRFRFVDPRGKPVNSKRIAFVTLRSGTGTTRRVTGRDPVWLPAERIVPLEGGLSRKSVEWSVQSVMVDGSNVVNRGQQRFVPGEAARCLDLGPFLPGHVLGSRHAVRVPPRLSHPIAVPRRTREALPARERGIASAAGAGTRPVRGERRRRRPLVHATGIPLTRSEGCTECDQLPRCRPGGRRDRRDPPRSAPRSPASASGGDSRSVTARP